MAEDRKRRHLVFLWAEDERYGPQFIAAYTLSEVDCLPEWHLEKRQKAEDEWVAEVVQEGEPRPTFFTTIQSIEEPTFEEMKALAADERDLEEAS